jgi:dGTPase
VLREQATRPASQRPLTRYAADLVVPRQQRLECALLKGVTAHYVMSRAGAAAAQAREREIITELADARAGRGAWTLDPMFRPAFEPLVGPGSGCAS